ncbi:hypothetical protein BMS3Abin07_02278 [bacterium BMS3Abin07]|nr:hypothetical protein BMS3Abin07_02278 [bacterium BMS3Abin07]
MTQSLGRGGIAPGKGKLKRGGVFSDEMPASLYPGNRGGKITVGGKGALLIPGGCNNIARFMCYYNCQKNKE